MKTTVGIYCRTLYYLKFVQICFRIIARFRKNKYSLPSVVPLVLKAKKPIIDYPRSRTGTLNASHYTIFDKRYALLNDWEPRGPKLLQYHQYYFDFLRYDESECFTEILLRSMINWIEARDVPTNAYDAYPTSLRIVNWIKFIIKYEIYNEKILRSIYADLNNLKLNKEYHILGNHLLTNWKAIIFASIFFEDHDIHKRTKKYICKYRTELKRQLTSDYYHFELSPSYHSVIVSDILDICNILQVYGYLDEANELLITAEKMIQSYEAILHPDSKIPFFNDSNYSNAVTINDLKEYYYKLRCVIPYIFAVNESGFYTLRDESVFMVCKCSNIIANYIPGHSHADVASFELSVNEQRVFVNTGVSTYDVCNDRLYERGTSSHNCLCIEEENTSEIWSSFRVGRRAKVISAMVFETLNQTEITCTHTGYNRAPFFSYHTRKFKKRNNEIQISDALSGVNQFETQRYFHLHPNICVEKKNEKEVLLFGNGGLKLELFTKDKNTEIQIIDGYFSKTFFSRVPSKSIRLVSQVSCPVDLTCTIRW